VSLPILRAAQSLGLLSADPEQLVAEARRSRVEPLLLASTRERLPREAFYRAWAQVRGLEFCEAAGLEAAPDLLQAAPQRLLIRKQVLPLRRSAGRVQVAISDPDDSSTMDTLRRVYGEVEPVIAEPASINLALRRHGVEAGGSAAGLGAVSFLDDLLQQAWLRRASDVHLDPQPEGLVIRLRVDGFLSATGGVLPPQEAAALVSRVKVLAGLDIAERRFPQDGSFSYEPSAEQRFEVRVATIPTRHGERATLRLLGADAEDLTIEHLGFGEAAQGRLRDALSQPHGMVLLTGPTGSGKTTTLYAALREIASPERNVMSVEDPVERTLSGVGQVQIGGKISFAGALRALLRHDPDVIMVGEVRDGETADVAVKAAMTGHLVLSSLHANRAAGAPARLVDLGCEPFLVAAVLRGALAQRLVRRLCQVCRRPAALGEREARALDPERSGLVGADIFGPAGCPACMGTGFRGRIALSEALWLEGPVAEALEGGAGEEELRRVSREQGQRPLSADALDKVLAGVTSVHEAMRVRI